MNISKKLTIVLTCILLPVTIATVASAQSEYYNEAVWGFVGIICFIYAMIYLVPTIVFIIIILKDAKKRGKSGAYALLGFLWLLGLIMWLVIRPDKKETPDRRCPNCGRIIPMDARACPYCAKKFEES